jgi:hypothetical protein
MALSAGARPPASRMASPTSSTCLWNCFSERFAEKPGTDSSLSMVPPVSPRPRPESLATGPPQAAAMGSEISEILSPTPPVECLSTHSGKE